jgi:glycosyltransferase involved in cell wall biosynthesis
MSGYERNRLAKALLKAQKQNSLVGIILKGYPRLSEAFIVNEILLLEECGYQLRIFALRDPGEAQVQENVNRVRAQVSYIPDDFWRSFFAFVRANFRAWRRFPRSYRQALWFAVHESVRQKDSAPLKRFAQGAYLACQNLSGNDVRHLHAHFGNDPTTVAFFASWLTGISYSFSAHAKDIYVQDRAFLQEKIARARFVVTCTEYNTNYLQSLRDQIGGATVIRRCYHGVDLKLFSPPEKRCPNAVPQILSVGRLVPKKGFPVLLQALHRLRLQGFDFHCTIIGEGPMAGALHKQIAGANLDDWVKLIPPMSQRELLQYYRSADLLALACEVDGEGDRDGVPNVIVEAMAMAIPVVSTRVSGIPECIEHGLNGMLVAEKDAAAFCEAMAKIISSSKLARELGRAGRRKVLHDFDARRNIAEIDAALCQTLAGNGREHNGHKDERMTPAETWSPSPIPLQFALDKAKW